MSRLTTTFTLAAMAAVGGAIVVSSLSSPGLSSSQDQAPSISSSVTPPYTPDDRGAEERETPSATLGPTGSTPTVVHLPTSVAFVRPVGINADGSMEIPDDPREVGWYTLTDVRPGDEGTAVIAGHVDSRTHGKGAFFELDTLRAGDEIVLETVDGPQSWTVTDLRVYEKESLPIVELFSLTGTPRLALVTCGGPFDPVKRSYRDNVVVYAHLSVPGLANAA